MMCGSRLKDWPFVPLCDSYQGFSLLSQCLDSCHVEEESGYHPTVAAGI